MQFAAPTTATDSLTGLGLSSLALHFLARRDIFTVAQLRAKSPRELLWMEKWLTNEERWDRQRRAGDVLFEIRQKLASRGLSLRGDRYTELAEVSLDRLNLSPRAAKVAARAGARTVAELIALSAEEMFSTVAFGETRLREIQHALASYGLCLRDGFPWPEEK